MPVILPLQPSVGNYQFRSILAGVEYRFLAQWNRREQAAYLTIREADNRLIAASLKVVLGVYIGRVVKHTLFRNGALVCRIPRGDDRREPQFDDLGSRVEVWYFTREEMFAEIVGALIGSPPT